VWPSIRLSGAAAAATRTTSAATWTGPKRGWKTSRRQRNSRATRPASSAFTAAHRPDLYRSLILSAPGIIPVVDVALLVKVRVAKCLATGRERERFPIPLDDPHLFTENPKRVRTIADDDLSLRELTARFMYESRRLDRMARAAAGTVHVPTLLLLAEHDRIINNKATRSLIYSMTARKRVITYAGAHHTLEFEPDPEPYFADLVAWIDQVEREARNV